MSGVNLGAAFAVFDLRASPYAAGTILQQAVPDFVLSRGSPRSKDRRTALTAGGVQGWCSTREGLVSGWHEEGGGQEPGTAGRWDLGCGAPE